MGSRHCRGDDGGPASSHSVTAASGLSTRAAGLAGRELAAPDLALPPPVAEDGRDDRLVEERAIVRIDEIVEREIPKPGAGDVRIKVQACGVCHSDVLTKEGYWPGIQYPRVPGHEVAGVIDEVGAGVSAWKKGQRVGVGWHGGQDNTCRECRRGDFRNCRNVKVCGISYDGGYQQYMVAPVEALVAIPDGMLVQTAKGSLSLVRF